MSKPKILVCVLCGIQRDEWVNPILTDQLLTIATHPNFDFTFLMVMNQRPWHRARNRCIAEARRLQVDACVQIDRDMTLPSDFAHILDDAIATGKDVVTLKTATFVE